MIKQKEAQLEKRQKEYEEIMKDRDNAMKSPEELAAEQFDRDPYMNRSMARSPKKMPTLPQGEIDEKKRSVEVLEGQIKENMDNIEAKMRETQNKMKMLERERALMQKKHSKACVIF